MCLLKLNFSTGFFELLLECFGFVLRNSFLYRTWSSVNDFLRLFQPETGEFLHSLNYCEFRSTCSGEDYIEFRLLFGTAAFATATRASSYCHCCSSRLDSVFVFQNFGKLIHLLYSEVDQAFCHCFQISHDC